MSREVGLTIKKCTKKVRKNEEAKKEDEEVVKE